MKLATIWKWLTGADPWHGMLDFGGVPTATGVRVDETSALNYSAVWAATRILSENIASLPLILYRRLPKGGKDRDFGNPLYRVLHDQPNSKMDSFSFWECSAAWLVNWGNAYSEIERDGAGRVIGLWPVHPSRVFVEQLSSTNIYHVHSSDGRAVPVPASRMLHLTGPLSDDGVIGKGVIQQARESIGLGIATERYGASFFGKGAKPQGVLKHPKALSELAIKNMRVSWAASQGGPENFGMPLILEQGTEWVPISIPPEDAQFLQTRQHNVTEIARWYRIPPHMLADLSRATFSNVEQQSLDFVIQSLRPWLVRIEKAIQRQLIGEEGNLAEFLVDALLRGDSVTRTQSLTQRWLNGNICQDEWRAIENLNPLPEGKGQIYFVPMNLTTIDRMIEGPQEPSPKEPTKDAPADADEEPEPAALGYNPDQPRDERGRFGEGGGGAKSAAKKSPWSARSKEEHEQYVSSQKQRIEAMRPRKDELFEKVRTGGASPAERAEYQDLVERSIVGRSMLRDAEKGYYRDENHWSNQPKDQQVAAFAKSIDDSPELEAKVERILSRAQSAGDTSAEETKAADEQYRERMQLAETIGPTPKESLAAQRYHTAEHIATQEDIANGAARRALAEEIRAENPVKVDVQNGIRGLPQSNLDKSIGFVAAATEANGVESLSVKTEQAEDVDRAYYAPASGVIGMSSSTPLNHVVHEMGHVIENSIPGAAEASQAFVKSRAGDAPFVSLSEKFPERGFFADEKGRNTGFESSFSDPVSGYYAGMVRGEGSSEALSMGLQELHKDPVGFIKRDRQYAKFVIGQLDGSLRAQRPAVIDSRFSYKGLYDE